MIFGYARVSTLEQNLEAQINELKNLGAEKIFCEKVTGTKKDRIELNNLLNQLRKGDTLIVLNIDRLARSLKDLIFFLELFSAKEIKTQIGALKLDFTTPEGRLYASLFGAIAQFERELIRERTLRGLKNAKAQGRVGGRPKGISPEALKKAKKAYELRRKGLTSEELLDVTGIKSKRTLYKYIRIYADNLVKEQGGTLSEDGLNIID